MGPRASAATTGRACRGRNTMNPSRKGITLAVLQLALVASLGAKYAIDRVRFPRVWAETVAYDPDLPIRGRYLSVRVRVDAHQVYGGAVPPKGRRVKSWSDRRDVHLRAEGHHVGRSKN